LNILGNVLSSFAELSIPPSPEPGSSFRSSYTSGLFSLRESIDSSATDVGSQNSVSDDSDSDDGGISDVVQMLDVRLVSVLSGNLDLAARLIPKLHAALDEDNDSVDCTVTDPTSDHHTSHQGGGESKGKETASGGCSSGRANQYSRSGSSSRKRGRGSGGVNRQNKGDKPSKKPRNDSAGNSGEDSNENPGQGEGNSQNEVAGSHTNGPSFNQQNRTSDPPEDDPGPADLFVSGNPPEWACHFHKRDHITYGPWNRKYASCFCSPRKQLRRIK